MKTVIVIGAGPAGMMTALSAAEHGAKVILMEKNSRPGRKLMITGKGSAELVQRLSFSIQNAQSQQFLPVFITCPVQIVAVCSMKTEKQAPLNLHLTRI